MKRLLLAAFAALASCQAPATAQEAPETDLLGSVKSFGSTLLVKTAPHGAVVVTLVNGSDKSAISYRQQTVETPYGPAVVAHRVTRNTECVPGCPDFLKVVHLPTGTYAPNHVVEVGEGRSGDLVILPMAMF